MKKPDEIAFLKTVELGSIRAAARALGQDPSGLSRRVTHLEQRLGSKLLDRAGNVTRVTAQGQMYYERLVEIVAEIDALEAEVSGENLTPRGLLRVTAAIDFGQTFVTDWLIEFRQQHADVDFDLMLASGFVDMSPNNIDVAIRAGHLPDSHLVAKKLADIPRVLVASPAYLDRVGRPRDPQDLETHEFVLFSPRNRTEPLELIDEAGDVHRVKRTRGVAINAVRSAVAAVRAGQGIHSGPLWAFAPYIANGEVELVLPKFKQKIFPLYAVRQPSAVVPARITQFMDFAAKKAKGIEGLSA